MPGGLRWPIDEPADMGRGRIPGRHGGVDLKVATGTSVMASADGTVVRASVHYQYGYVVIVDHGTIGDEGQRVYTLYAHLSHMGVQAGQQVSAGEKIGESGGVKDTEGAGNSEGAHLHYEVIQAPTSDPLPWNPTGPTGVNPYQYREDPLQWRGSEADPEMVPVGFHADPEFLVDSMEAIGRLELEEGLGIGEDDSVIEVASEEFDVLQTSSPVILDLNGDGVETKGLMSGAFFDHAGDGFREETGWVETADGLLVLDRNGNGIVDDGRELFGNQTPLGNGATAADGYQALAELDANADGKVDASDPAWSQLRVWQDTDGDGVSSGDEVRALPDVGVAGVATASTPSTFVDVHGNEHRLVGTYTRSDGTSGATADVWFRVDQLYSVADNPLEVPADVAALPNIRGYGTVYDLHQAMVRDAPGALKSLVQQFVAQPDAAQRAVILEQIIFKWTGSDAIDPASRGPYIDARKLGVLERTYGEAFIGIEGTGNPNAVVGGVLNSSYQTVAELVSAQLLAKTHVQNLWDLVTYRWDAGAQRVTGDLSATVGELQHQLTADPAAGVVALSEFARSIRGFGLEGMLDYWTFRDAFAAQGEDIAWAVDSGGKALIAATDGDDMLTGDWMANAIRGGDGNDTLSGDEGEDVLYGQGGADTLIGGSDADVLEGGPGNDSLEGRRGNDRLFGRADDDTLLGEAGDDVLDGGDGSDSLDGSDGNDILLGGAGADTLLGREQDDALFGGDGDDSLAGNRGDDTVSGEAGNDALSGEDGGDVLDGGAGDDSLNGGSGNDTYLFGRGSGQDVIVDRDSTAGNLDAIVLGADIAPSDVQASREVDDLVLRIAGTSDQLRVTSWFAESAPRQYEVEEVRFDDGTVWSRDTLSALVIVPTEGPDSLTGFATADVLQGLGGDDTLDGRGGDDRLEGGPGSDALVGDAGNDTLLGGAGADSLHGNEGNDSLLGGEGDDMLSGDRGDDTLAGEEGNDSLYGVGGADILEGGAGDDFLDGGSENDSLDGGSGHDVLVGDNGNDTLRGGSGVDSLGGNAGDDILYGGADDDMLSGDRDNDVLNGEAGNDRLDGGFGIDVLVGGTGDDTYVVDNVADVVTEASGEGTDMIETSLSFALPANVERLVLTGTAAINGTGNALNNRITGNGGANTLSAGAGDDTLDGGAGADTLVGGTGNDTYAMVEAADVVTELAGEGTDTIETSLTASLPDHVENLTLTGTADIDGTGNAASNTLTGNSAVNRLSGGAGADTMVGGAGDDTYVIDDVADTVLESVGEGMDTLETSVNYTLPGNVERLTLTGATAVAGSGNAFDNTLTGNSAANRLDGGAGADTMAGGAGDDTYVVDNAADTASEMAGEGTDTVESSVTYALTANVENLTLTGSGAINGTGNALANRLTGNGAANVLNGGEGHDLLEGGGGADTMAGGPGDDTYGVADAGDVVTELAGEGVDTIKSSVTYTLPTNVENLGLSGVGTINGTGNTLNNRLTGSLGANTLNGGAGDDVLDGGSGADTLVGGTGNDTYVVADAGDIVTELASQGTDTIEASLTYALPVNVENLTLTGTAAIDGTGNSASNTLTGNGAANRLSGGSGVDTMAGGAGDDTYIVDNVADTVLESVNEGTDAIESSVTYVLSPNVERLTLTGSGAINGTGNPLNNTLIGNTRANVLEGGAGADAMAGGDGDDTYAVDDAADTVTEAPNQGTDTIQSAVTYALPGNVERLTLIGAVAINATGNALNNTLTGNSAANVLDGGLGTDTMAGGAGDDTYVVERATDAVQETSNAGTDTVLSSASYTLPTNVENLILTGTGAINGTGNTLGNVLQGNSAANVLEGRMGNDTYLFARGAGQDVIRDLDFTTANRDTLAFAADLDPLDLIISRTSMSLRIAVQGSSDRVEVQSWYWGGVNQVEVIRAGDGRQLLNTQVEQLIQAMASYSAQTGLTWEQAIAQRPEDVETILAAHWQPAAG